MHGTLYLDISLWEFHKHHFGNGIHYTIVVVKIAWPWNLYNMMLNQDEIRHFLIIKFKMLFHKCCIDSVWICIKYHSFLLFHEVFGYFSILAPKWQFNALINCMHLKSRNIPASMINVVIFFKNRLRFCSHLLLSMHLMQQSSSCMLGKRRVLYLVDPFGSCSFSKWLSAIVVVNLSLKSRFCRFFDMFCHW